MFIIGCRKEESEYFCIDCECNSREECNDFRKENGLKPVIQE